MATNDKTLPDIKGTEAISATWRRLLERDRNASNFFAGNAFTTDQTSTDIGRPNWRTDLNRLFIYDGTNFVNLFKYLTPQEIAYTIDHPDVPEETADVKTVLDILVKRNNLNTVVFPADSVEYTGTGTTTTFALPNYTSNKATVHIYIDGVKQSPSTYSLTDDGESVTFEVAPAVGENIEINQSASLLEYDYTPIVKTFDGDGTTKEFDFGTDILNPMCLSVNVSGKELQKSEFSVKGDGHTVVLEAAPSASSKLQIFNIGKTSYITVSPNSIGAEEIKDGSITSSKMAEALPVNMNSIPNGGITTDMLAASSVTTTKINDKAITNAKLGTGSVSEDKLATAVQNKLLGSQNVSAANIADAAVGYDKLGADVKDLITSMQNDILTIKQKLGI